MKILLSIVIKFSFCLFVIVFHLFSSTTFFDLVLEEIEQLKFYRQHLFIINDEKTIKKNKIEKTTKTKTNEINVEVKQEMCIDY
jgi:hypothetical protein